MQETQTCLAQGIVEDTDGFHTFSSPVSCFRFASFTDFYSYAFYLYGSTED